jgi:hypothetical protein
VQAPHLQSDKCKIVQLQQSNVRNRELVRFEYGKNKRDKKNETLKKLSHQLRVGLKRIWLNRA